MESVTTRNVLLAAVIGAHGLKGEVKLKLFTGELARYPRLHAKDGRVFSVKALRGEVASFAEVADRSAAEALKGVELFVDREALPATEEGEFYHADLIGLTAMDEADREIGTIQAIHNYGAGDVIEIARASVDGRGSDTVMLPFARDFVPVVDIAAGRVVVAVPEDKEAQEGEAQEGEAQEGEEGDYVE
ncbi:MAG: 16S rRNA processing protein RimM [Alphaproteobacteria bacterium]|nr:16S rRNA processing protein RimM [Alphaproteobacteria bacterium]